MRYILSLLLLLAIYSCGASKQDSGTLTYEGFLEVQGITTYQYGSHTLTTDNGVYALTSDTIILDDFDSEAVIITAKKVNGYPVDGGPIYLNVQRIELKN